MFLLYNCSIWKEGKHSADGMKLNLQNYFRIQQQAEEKRAGKK